MAKKKGTDGDSERTEIAVRPATDPPSTLGLIQMALAQNIDPDKLTKLFDLHERNEKNKAIIAYNNAMNAAQGEMPTIKADSFNNQTKSAYISVEGLNKSIKPIYAKHGFSLSFGEGTPPKEGLCRTTCEVRHIGGHSESFYLDLPLDGVGIKGNANMTAIHGRLSSDTYAQGRLLRKIFNLTVVDDETDNDGNEANCITADQMADLNKIIDEIRSVTTFDMDAFLKWLQVKSIDKIQVEAFTAVKRELERKLAEGHAIKVEVDRWKAYLDDDPHIDVINTYLVQAFAKMDDSKVKRVAWAYVLERLKKGEVVWDGKAGKFGVKGA